MYIKHAIGRWLLLKFLFPASLWLDASYPVAAVGRNHAALNTHKSHLNFIHQMYIFIIDIKCTNDDVWRRAKHSFITSYEYISMST